MKALILFLIFFSITVAISQLGQATRTLLAGPQMKTNESPTLNQTKQQNHTKLVGTCSYLVTIYTSCHSPYYAKDQIDIKFGDAYGNEVYVPRLDKIVGAVFEPCWTTTFKITAQCINKICKLFLFRKGLDGWIPEKVTAADSYYPPITFYYNSYIPDDDYGYGSNFCVSV